MRVLVTGAGGFIGSHLSEELVRRGHEVRALVHYNSLSRWGWLEGIQPMGDREIEIFAGDVRDSYGVRTAMKGCEAVLHLAALIGIPYSYSSPDAYVDTNVRGTLNVLQAARDFGDIKVVHTSTSEVYGSAQFVPITEEHPIRAQSPYAATKIAADQLALSFFRSFGTPVTVVRPFNTYGPRQSTRAVIPTIIAQAMNGRTSIQLGSVHTTRDFNHVSDTIAGFIAAMESSKGVGEVINLGSGFEIAIGDVVSLIADIMGIKLSIALDAARLRPPVSEVNRLFASNEKAMRLLGWSPAYAGKDGFQRGLKETVSWFSQPGNLKRYKAEIYNI